MRSQRRCRSTACGRPRSSRCPTTWPWPCPTTCSTRADALRRLVDTLEERRAAEGGDDVRLPIGEPYRFDDCGWVANRWCELLPMPTELKQRLMELDSPLMRLELVSDLLRPAAGIVEVARRSLAMRSARRRRPLK